MTENTRLVQQLKEFYHGEKGPAIHRFAEIARVSLPEADRIINEEWDSIRMAKSYEEIVKSLKNNPEVDNPFALAHYIKNKEGSLGLSSVLLSAKISLMRQAMSKPFNGQVGNTKTAKDKISPESVGYVEGPTPKQCKTCIWFQGPNVCNLKNIGLSIPVDPIKGCCNDWEDKFDKTKTKFGSLFKIASIDIPTDETVIDWYTPMNVSKRQHSIDPNRLEDAISLELCKKEIKDMTDEEFTVVKVGYAFRHQLEDTTKILGVNINKTPQTKWDSYNVSQRMHMIDPHQMFDSLPMCMKSYDELSVKEKKQIDDILDERPAEQSQPTKEKSKIAVMKDLPQFPCLNCGNRYHTKSSLLQHQEEAMHGQHAFRQASLGPKFRFASLELETGDGQHATYFILAGDVVNGREWGVTEESIPRNIESFIGMPFVITSSDYIEGSPYGKTYDHPSTEHFPVLGIAPAGSYDVNDINLIKRFQNRFAIGKIVKVYKKDDVWRADVTKSPKYAHVPWPPFCSPAIYMTNPHEPDDKIESWTALHLAGLDQRPAYGNIALLKGTCNGDYGGVCEHQLRAASETTLKQFSPCRVGKLMEAIKQSSSLLAALDSGSISDTEVINLLQMTDNKKKKKEAGDTTQSFSDRLKNSY